MYDLLKTGQQVTTHFSKQTYEVEKNLGRGIQGEVYQARLIYHSVPVVHKHPSNLFQAILEKVQNVHEKGESSSTHLHTNVSRVALKWYFPHSTKPDQIAALERLIKRGKPNPEDDKFLWPLDLVSTAEISGFGYIMPLREERYKGIRDLMDIRKPIDPTFRALITAGFELVSGYSDLHLAGLCYGDISISNAFFDPITGDVCICDNDNVVVNGQTCQIWGTDGFMAPELIRREALPTRKTDLHSLAVLLFYMFMLHHPLEGKRESDILVPVQEDLIRLYGTEPLFIFDPDNRSNYPVRGEQDSPLIFWRIYPQFLRDLFIQAFTKGLHYPDERVVESQWRRALVRLRDLIVYCPLCGKENFFDIERFNNNKKVSCWYCTDPLPFPLHMQVNRLDSNEQNIIMLNHDTKLYPYHIQSQGTTYDFSHPVAEIIHDGRKILGLKNISQEKWILREVNGTTYDAEVQEGMVVPLFDDVKILFGNIQGEIRTSFQKA